MSTMRSLASLLVIFAAMSGITRAAEYAEIPAIVLRTVLPPDGKDAPARVAAFQLRTLPVTNGEFLAFTRTRPEWRRDKVPVVFADGNYLAHWTRSDALGDAGADQPVTDVSWFAATAYCESEHARLPTWHEWEVAGSADETRRDARSDGAWRNRILAWYSRPSLGTLPSVGKTPKNVYGLYDMHAVVWEWVEDFNALMVSADNREQGDSDLLKFCGAGALSVADRENYPVLMRIALLSSLEAQHTTRNLGFRCARSVGTVTP